MLPSGEVLRRATTVDLRECNNHENRYIWIDKRGVLTHPRVVLPRVASHLHPPGVFSIPWTQGVLDDLDSPQ